MPRIYKKVEMQITNPRPANQCKGFYTKVLKEAEKMDFETVNGLEGLDDEIALLRVKIKALVKRDPQNTRLFMDATNLLAQLVKTRYYISDKQKTGLGEAIKNVIRDIAVPAGIAILKKKL
jgi:hypothetical protein